MELFEKKVSSKQIFDGKIVKLFVDEVELPNGEIATREIVRHPGAVCVGPLTNEGEVVMVRQFRYPFEEVLLEIPAGKLEIGEDPLEAAKRELEEESGAVAGKIEYMGELYTTVAIFDERIQMYIATDLTFKDSHPDSDEFITSEKIPLSTLIDMVMRGEIKDSKTQIALFKAEKYIKGNK